MYVCIFILIVDIYIYIYICVCTYLARAGGFKIILIVGKALISPFLGTSICAHT